MEFKFPKVIQSIALKEYAPEMGDAVVEVWVNPPRSTWGRIFELSTDVSELAKDVRILSEKDPKGESEELQAKIGEMKAATQEIFSWYAEVWGQGSEDHRPTREQVEQLATSETDPAFYTWLTRRTLELIRNWRSGVKKE